MTLNIDKRPTWLILLFAAMLLIFVSCSKSDLPNPDKITQSEKGKPLGCGEVIPNSAAYGSIDLSTADCVNPDLFCGNITSIFTKNVALHYTQSVKFTLDFIPADTIVYFDISFIEKSGTITYPSRLREAVWLNCELVSSAIGFNAPLKVTPGLVHRLGIVASPCNFKQCNPASVVISMR